MEILSVILTKISKGRVYNEDIKEKEVQRIVIYIDVFWMVNFVMDMIVLVVVKRLLKFTATYLRIAASAALGAAWACMVEIFGWQGTWYIQICTYIFIAAIMVKICAGKCNYKDWLKGVLVMYATACLLGGAGHMLYYYTQAGYWLRTVVFGDRMLVGSLFWGGMLLLFLERYINEVKIYRQNTFRVTVMIQGKSLCFRGFLDTGNVLKDPVTGKLVHIVEQEKLQPVFNEIDDYTLLKYRMIPFASLGADNGLIEVITADKMYIYKDEVVTVMQPLLGITRQTLSGDGAYDMLLNGGIFK